MAVDLKQVKALREETGLGFMDCKRALEEADGDSAKAVDILRKKGMASADRRAHRAADQGRVALAIDPEKRSAALVELRSESDFVSRGEDFSQLAEALAVAALKAGPGVDADQLAGKPAPTGEGTVADAIAALSGKVGEKVVLHRAAVLPAPRAERTLVGGYLHHNGRVGSAVRIAFGKESSAGVVEGILRDLAMHVVAHVPVPAAVGRDGLPADVLEKERAIQADTDEIKKKPEQIREKILQGKMDRFIKDRALLEQLLVTVTDEKVTVGDFLKRKGKEAGDDFVVEAFLRLELGEE